MTVPPLMPTSVNNRVFGAADWKLIRSLLGHSRDSAPTFIGQLDVGSIITEVLSGQVTLAGASTVADGTFAVTPEVNIGGWSAGTEGDEPLGVIVPTAGVYLLRAWVTWAGDSTGRRVVMVYVNRKPVKAALNEIAPAGTTPSTNHECETVVRLQADDEIHVALFHSASTNIGAFPVYLAAQWIVA